MSEIKKRVPWVERSELIKGKFPSTARLDWYEVFRQDPAILGKIINDIMKLDQARSGKPGKRPSLEEADAQDKLRKLQGEDYSELEFQYSFKNLSGKRSIRMLARKLSLEKSYVHRLLQGKIEPTAETMEQIAKAFNKHPSYFLEYRIYYVLAMLSHKLVQSPESSIVFYNRLAGRNERVAV